MGGGGSTKVGCVVTGRWTSTLPIGELCKAAIVVEGCVLVSISEGDPPKDGMHMWR